MTTINGRRVDPVNAEAIELRRLWYAAEVRAVDNERRAASLASILERLDGQALHTTPGWVVEHMAGSPHLFTDADVAVVVEVLGA